MLLNLIAWHTVNQRLRPGMKRCITEKSCYVHYMIHGAPRQSLNHDRQLLTYLILEHL